MTKDPEEDKKLYFYPKKRGFGVWGVFYRKEMINGKEKKLEIGYAVARQSGCVFFAAILEDPIFPFFRPLKTPVLTRDDLIFIDITLASLDKQIPNCQ